MKLRILKSLMFIAGVLGCTMLLQRCNKPTTIEGPAKITFSGNDGGLITVEHKNPRTGTIEKKIVYQSDPKSTIIKTDEKGNVTVSIRQFGVGFEPGIGFGYSDKARLALDVRFAYYRRWGAHTGLGISVYESNLRGTKLLDLAVPYVGISYVPFTHYSNTSIVVAYTLKQNAFVFIRVRF